MVVKKVDDTVTFADLIKCSVPVAWDGSLFPPVFRSLCVTRKKTSSGIDFRFAAASSVHWGVEGNSS